MIQKMGELVSQESVVDFWICVSTKLFRITNMLHGVTYFLDQCSELTEIVMLSKTVFRSVFFLHIGFFCFWKKHTSCLMQVRTRVGDGVRGALALLFVFLLRPCGKYMQIDICILRQFYMRQLHVGSKIFFKGQAKKKHFLIRIPDVRDCEYSLL